MKARTKWIIGVCAAAALAGVSQVGCKRHDVRYNKAAVGNQAIEIVVTATGYVQPVDKVDVGTQVSGVIEKIFVDFNTPVKKGQMLAELDKSTLIEKVTSGKASVVSAESDLRYNQQNFDRTRQLYEAKAATKAAYEQAENALAQSKTSVANAKANLHQAQVNLSYAEIYSPIDGVVLNRAVDQGQTVAASFNTPTLFTIAKDLTRMQVEANVDEADIGQVKVGQKVTFTVDSYSDLTFEGTVSQVRLQPTVTSNVVTYTVIIEAPNPDEKLFPGMTASVTIVTDKVEGPAVLAEALNFEPETAMSGKRQGGFPGPGAPGGMAKRAKAVWVPVQGGGIERREVETGLSDGVYTLVTGGLNVGDSVILSVYVPPMENKKAASNPFMPKRPGRR